MTISYRPEGGSWVDRAASYYSAGDYWIVDWVIPSYADLGPYDLKVEVWDEDGGFASRTELGKFNVVNVDPSVVSRARARATWSKEILCWLV